MSVYQSGLAQDAAYGAARATYQAAKEKIVQGGPVLPNLNLTANGTTTRPTRSTGGRPRSFRERSTTLPMAQASTSPSPYTGRRIASSSSNPRFR